MKNRFGKLLCLVLTLVTMLSLNTVAFAAETNLADTPRQYEITVGDTTVVLAEGEKATFSMELLDGASELLRGSSQTVIGDAGILTVWGSGNYFYWDITMFLPATTFVGYVSGMNLTTGLSSGMAPVTGFSGSCRIGFSAGHMYSGSISGTASLGTIPIAKTVSNWINWVA